MHYGRAAEGLASRQLKGQCSRRTERASTCGAAAQSSSMTPAYLLDGCVQEAQLVPGRLLISDLGGREQCSTSHKSVGKRVYGRAAGHM
jgi:hypothetical protein